MNDKVNIQVDREVRNKLEELKIIPREPFNDVIKRLLEERE